MAYVVTGADDVDRLLKLARRLEQDGRKTAAEITYSAASEIARVRAAMPDLLDLLERSRPYVAKYEEREGSNVALDVLIAIDAALRLRSLNPTLPGGNDG